MLGTVENFSILPWNYFLDSHFGSSFTTMLQTDADAVTVLLHSLMKSQFDVKLMAQDISFAQKWLTKSACGNDTHRSSSCAAVCSGQAPRTWANCICKSKEALAAAGKIWMARDYSRRAESERNHLFACCNTMASGGDKSGCRRIFMRQLYQTSLHAE